ncbi:MAG: DUF4342 domain-containing protein [Candidatus Bathyarchaeia archaeon]
MVTCNGCSTEISENTKYCPNCGKNTAKTIVEEFDVKSEELIQKTKEILHEGNVTRLIVENEEGKTLLEIPATVGIVGVFIAPWLAALGAIAAVATKCKIKVERKT